MQFCKRAYSWTMAFKAFDNWQIVGVFYYNIHEGAIIMTDLYALLRAELAEKAGKLLGTDVAPAQIDCVADEYPARSAIPLAQGADAAEWALILQNGASAFTLFGVPLVQTVTHNGGHLLFAFTDEFYTAALHNALLELPRIDTPAIRISENDAAMARLSYTLRRMWMLSRKAQGGEIACPSNPAIQRALYLALGALGRLDHPRALTLRLLEASDALLTMTRSVLPRQRPALCAKCAHVGDAAARVFALGLRTLTTTDK